MPTKKKTEGETLGKLCKEPPGVYRYTRHGRALRQALEQLTKQKKITPFLEMWVMKVFDSKMTQRLSQLGERQQQPIVNFLASGVKKHSLLDGGWEIHLKDVQIQSDAFHHQLDQLVILADNFEDKSFEKSKNIKSQLKSF